MVKRGISLLAMMMAMPAWAQAADESPDMGNDRSAIIVTASRVVMEAREIGSSVSVVTAQDLKRNQITFVKDVLQDVPGVFTTTDRPGNYTGVSIRGSDNDEILWLVDGIQMGDPSSTSTEYRADHLTAHDISRVEILRGNQSSLYGSDAIGGVVNIITQRASEEGVKVNAEAEAGSYGTLNGGASVLGKSGPLDFRVTATGYRHDGPSLADPRTATGPASEKDEYWRYGFSGRAGYQATDSLSFQMLGFWQDSFSDLDNTTSDSGDTVHKKEYAFAGQGAYRSADGRFRADLTGSRYVARRLYFGTWYSPEGDVYRGTLDNLALNMAYGGEGVVSVAAGGNVRREKSYQTATTGAINHSTDIKSAYGEIALRPVAGMTITGAARIDDNSRFGSFDTYRGTFAYALGGLKLRASYGTGAKAPGLYQLFDPRYGNPDLKVQTSKGGDVGFDLSLSEGLTMQMSYFYGSKRNEINWDCARPVNGCYYNYGRTRADGIEIGVNARPLPWLTIGQTYTYTDHRVKTEANATAAANRYIGSGRPKYMATTSVTVTPVERATLTMRARWRDGDSSSAYSPPTKAYTVVDLLGSYGITEKVEVYGRVVNLFDKWYQGAYGYQTLGLSAYGGVRVSF